MVDRPRWAEVKPLQRGGVSETSPVRSKKTQAVLARSAILHAHDEAQAGPDIVDRAHLVVDEPLPETDLADDVLVEVGGHAGSSLGHAIQRPPAGSSAARSPLSSFASRALEMKNATITSASPPARGTTPSERAKPSGAARRRTRECSRMPSFRGKGVPE